jgi:site-specific DNA recombinase
VITWLQREVINNDRHQHTARQATIQRHEEEAKRIEARIETMYLDKLDGKITSSFYEQKAKEWRAQQERVRHTINELRLTTAEPLDEAVNLLDMTSKACETFTDQPAEEQRRLLGIVLERATWKDRALGVTLLEPFQTLRHSNSASSRKHRTSGGTTPNIEDWLPDMDSNHDSRLQRPLSYH